MKPRCDWCGRPTSERYPVFAKGDDPPPDRRLADALGAVCLACRNLLRAYPEKAGLPKSCRRQALDECEWGPVRAAVAVANEAPSFDDDADEVFRGLR